MATLLKDDAGIPIPQYQNTLGEFEPSKGADGAFKVNDAQIATLIDRVETIQNRVATIVTDVAAIKTDVAAIKDVLGTRPNSNASTAYDLFDSMNAHLSALVTALSNGGIVYSIASDVSDTKADVADIKTSAANIDTNTSNP